MFISEKKLRKIVRDIFKSSVSEAETTLMDLVNITDLKKEIIGLKDDKADLVREKSQESQEIQHLVKIEREKNQMDVDKRQLELKGEFAQKELDMKDDHKTKEMELQKEYFDKHMALIKTNGDDTKKMYSEIMKRLPNVNMSIKQHTGVGDGK